MFNQGILMGRLTRDPVTRYLQGSDNSVTEFTLAVDREYKVGGESKTDFIKCTAWNKTGEFIAKHFSQGSMILVVGSIETDSYTNKDGVKVYTTGIRVSKASFTGEKRGNSTDESNLEPSPDGFMNIPDGVEDSGLPFN